MMHASQWLSLSMALSLLAGAAGDEVKKPIYSATVMQPDVLVWSRAGNSPEIYPTNLLKRGERVQVLEERPDGWLAVVPPEGSFSWIEARFVKQAVPDESSLWVVVTHPDVKVPVLMATTLRNVKPSIIGASVDRGTLLRGIGPPQLPDPSANDKWLPVKPPPGEVRFVQKAAVRRDADGTPPRPLRVASDPSAKNPQPPPALGVGTANPVKNKDNATTDPLWVKAQQAEQNGQVEEAVRLYRQLGRDVQSTNHGLAMQAFNRAQYLENRYRRPAPAPRRDPPATLTGRQPSSAPAPAGSKSIGPGTLKRGGYYLKSRRAYVLESTRGQRLTYVIANGNLNLELYVNRRVMIVGERIFDERLRSHYVVAQQVRVLP